jgi:ADP-heptose:LPS heptosyltransferase
MMNKLKDRIYDLILYFAASGLRKKPSQKKILIVRVDEIGDYMLWHSLLPEIISSDAYTNSEFHFYGNQSWKKLFDQFDAGFVQQSFWMDKQRFKTKILYRYRLLKQVYKQGYDTVINPTFSRDKRYDDSIVIAARSPHRIGMVSNKESVRTYETGYDRNLYTRLFDHPQKPVFEFYRNRMFAEFVSGNPSPIADTGIDTGKLPGLSITLPEKYFVVFPGSRNPSRIWPAENYVQVSNYLFIRYGYTAVLCGTKSDTMYTNAFAIRYTNPLLDLTGQTSLPDMLSVFKNAECLLSVDTGSVHLAAAVNCPVFGIFNGSQYGRFAPYPESMATGFHAIYPDDVEEELKDSSVVLKKYEFVVAIPYASVQPEKVISAISQYL